MSSNEVNLSTLYTVSSSPHIRSVETVPKIMWNVVLALLPALCFSVYIFGYHALGNIIVSVISAMLTEYLVQKIRGKNISLWDGSAFLTGLLLVMCLPPDLPYYMTALGSFFAIAVAKHSMGGLGYNIFNPAHIGRAALMLSWPIAMTSWSQMKTHADVISSSSLVDGVTSATPLNILKHQGYSKLVETFGSNGNMYYEMFLGFRNGSLGETSALLLIIGGIYLIYRQYIQWEVPFFMIGTVALTTWIFGPSGLFTGDPLFHVLAGGLIIGAFFMATDMVTTPITKKGKIIFAIGAGLITTLIRLKGGYPEGVCYSILLMNAVTPLIDRLVKTSNSIYGGK